MRIAYNFFSFVRFSFLIQAGNNPGAGEKSAFITRWGINWNGQLTRADLSENWTTKYNFDANFVIRRTISRPTE